MRLPSRVWPFLVFVLVAPLVSAAPPAARPEVCGRLTTENGVHVLRLWGTPTQRGYAHGYLMAENVIGCIDTDLKRLFGAGAKGVVAMATPLAEKAFAFSADETAELEAMLAGIRARLAPEKRVVALLGREITLTDLKLLNTLGDWYALGCSSAALWGEKTRDGTPTVLRNFDFPGLATMTMPHHVRIVAPTGDEASHRGWVGISHPGGIGALTAMNQDGVFVSIHDVHVRPGMQDLMQQNVPRLIAMKRLMQQLGPKGACEKARDLFATWPTLYGNNILIATPKPGDGLCAGVLEYDTREDKHGGVDLRGPDAVGGTDGKKHRFVVCSNHHRMRAAGKCGRYDRLVKGCLEPRPENGRTVAELFALASRSAVPGPDRTVKKGGFGTLHQAVALTGTRRLWLRFLAPDSNIRQAKPVEFDVAALVKALVEASAPAGR
jgi:hypothetical protein